MTTAPKYYIKRPIPVAISEPFDGTEEHAKRLGLTYHHTIITLEGPLRVPKGHRIVTGVKGERYAIAPDIFDLTYVEAPHDA